MPAAATSLPVSPRIEEEEEKHIYSDNANKKEEEDEVYSRCCGPAAAKSTTPTTETSHSSNSSNASSPASIRDGEVSKVKAAAPHTCYERLGYISDEDESSQHEIRERRRLIDQYDWDYEGDGYEEEEDDDDDDSTYLEEDLEEGDPEYGEKPKGSRSSKEVHRYRRKVETLEGKAEALNPYFIIVSLAYMASWTVIGSLVSYFKEIYGPSFFVKLNCAFYLPGLPVSVIQQYFDEHVDSRYGSYHTYYWRNVLGFVVMILVLLIIPSTSHSSPNTKLYLTSIIGIFSWLCHGTSTMLVSMFPPASLAYLQTGFRLPEFYVLLMVGFLGIGSHPAPSNLHALFYMTAMLVAGGLYGWTCILKDPATQTFLQMKDEREGVAYAVAEIDIEEEAEEEEKAMDEELPLLYQQAGGGGDDSTGGKDDLLSLRRRVMEDDPGMIKRIQKTKAAATGGEPSSYMVWKTKLRGSGNRRSGYAAAAAERPGMRSLTDYEKSLVEATIFPCRLALFLTIWSSIFQASFFAYVNSSSSSNSHGMAARHENNLPEILYFVRLFADFIARPLTRIQPRPRCLQEPWQLVYASVWRLLLTLVFFLYISVPGFPQSDPFIILLVAVFSVLSGFFGVLSYEYATHGFESKALQAYAGTVMNTTFQTACFTAVISGLFFIDLRLV